MSKKNSVKNEKNIESDFEIFEIDKKTYKGLQDSLDTKHSLYVAAKEREYEAVQQKNTAMEALKKVTTKCSELMIKNQRGKIDNIDLDKKRLDGDELEKHIKTKYESSESKKCFDEEISKMLIMINDEIYETKLGGSLHRKVTK
jgi:hypothetical protein